MMFCTLFALALLGSRAGGTEPLLPMRRKSFSEPNDAAIVCEEGPSTDVELNEVPWDEILGRIIAFGDALLAGGDVPGEIPSKSFIISWLTHLQTCLTG